MGTTAELIRFDATATSSASRDGVLRLLQDLPAHLEWGGTRSSQKTFRLLSIDAPEQLATVGTRFSSTGANMNGTFHDDSVVVLSEPYTFAFETVSRLDRRHGAELIVRFAHRYDLTAHGTGTGIAYSCSAHSGSYVPYWLKPGLRSMTRAMVNRSMTKQLRLLAELAEERALMTERGC